MTRASLRLAQALGGKYTDAQVMRLLSQPDGLRKLALVMHPVLRRHDYSGTSMTALVRELKSRSTPAFRSAWLKGLHAGLAGRPKKSNPYGDDRTLSGRITFARAFWREWGRGWAAAREHLAGR